MATKAEKREIARQFILASPCHELLYVVKDVRVLVADDALVDELLPEVVREYNMANQVAAPSPYGDHRAILSAATCRDADDTTCHDFLDTRTGRYFRVTNHLKLHTTEAPGEAAQDSFQGHLQAKMDEYIGAHYPEGTGVAVKTGDATYTLLVNSERSSTASAWSGRWRSRLDITCTGEGGNWTGAEAKGEVRNAVHYYESGNVQMDTSKELGKTWEKVVSPDALARQIVLFLDNSEMEFHMKLDEMCQTLSDKSLKTLRRRLPVSKQLFNFSTSAHSLAAELTRGLPEK